MSFRQKFFLSYLAIFVLILVLIFPYSAKSVRSALRKVLETRTDQVIDNIDTAPNIQGMIQKLSAHQSLVLFRVTLLTKDGRILYESHMDRSSQPLFKKHPEIEDARKHRIGYHEDHSYHFGEQFAYIAKSFKFQGQTYILRTAFPIKQIEDLSKSFKLVLVQLGVGILVLFSLLTWVIMSLLIKPIQTIIRKIKTYQASRDETLPKIEFEDKRVSLEFRQLADTLNSLSNRIQKQIEALRDERNQTQSVLNSLEEGVIAVDNRLMVTFSNATAFKMFALLKEDFIGQHISVLKSHKFSHLLSECIEKQKVIYDTIELKNGNQNIPLGVIVSPHKSLGALLVLQDKTSVYQILNMGKAFIANASHELKTPLTIIRGFAETLSENPEMALHTRQDVMTKIVENCNRMDTLVRNLLQLTDIENLPSSQLKACDLTSTLEDCITTLQALHDTAQVQLQDHLQGQSVVMANPDLLHRAFMNLLENAVKYNPNKPIIQIEIESDPKGYKVLITDNGMGIPSKDLPHIFQRFYRVDKARSRKMGGSGLGLSIVQTILEKIGASIAVHSKEDEGTTFTLIFPEITS